jgi:hypothetical protein
MNLLQKPFVLSVFIITIISIFLLGIMNHALAVETKENNKESYIILISKQENKENNKAVYDADVQKRAKEINTLDDLLKANEEEMNKKEHITWSGQVLDDKTFKNRMAYCVDMQMKGLVASVDDGTVCSFYVLTQEGEQAIVSYILSPEQIELREKAEKLDYYIDQLNK